MQGRLEEAETLHRRALEIAQKANGPGHPASAYSLHGLAVLAQAKGQGRCGDPEKVVSATSKKLSQFCTINSRFHIELDLRIPLGGSLGVRFPRGMHHDSRQTARDSDAHLLYDFDAKDGKEKVGDQGLARRGGAAASQRPLRKIM